MEPEVLYFLICDDVRTDPTKPWRYDVLGLITTIRSKTKPPFPVVKRRLCALLFLTECQGNAELLVRIWHDRTSRIIFRGPPRCVLLYRPS